MEQIEKDRIILAWIKYAKECWVYGKGMCNAFNNAIYRYVGLKDNLVLILKDMGHDLCIYDGEVMYRYRSDWLTTLIPEFNFDFLGGDKNTEAYKNLNDNNLSIHDIYWWDRLDTESRIKAFDKLIKVYEAKVYGKSL